MLARISILKERSKLIILTILLENPVELPIIFPTVTFHHSLEKTSQVVVIGLLLKLDVAAVLDILSELFGRCCGQLFNSGRTLLLTNFVILIILVLASKALPGQRSFKEVKQNVAD